MVVPIKFAITFAMGALAVGIGAFGAHALESAMDSYSKDIFNTGSRYHFYHTLLMLGICLLILLRGQHALLTTAWYFSLTGIVLFSGSLYLLATRSTHSIPANILGPITPLGGIFFIVAWVLLCIYVLKFLK